MFSERKHRSFLGLGLAVALALTMSPATASAVSTLTDEFLFVPGSGGVQVICNSSGPYSYTVSGTATGPYPGTFTETGSGTVDQSNSTATLSASFTITSPTTSTTITGSKSGSGGEGCRDSDGDRSIAFCSIYRCGLAAPAQLSYQATLHTSTGNFTDQGTSDAVMTLTPSDTESFFEVFASSLTAPVPLAPTSKDQCKNNGWKDFPQFKNQGQCVSFVESHRQN